MTLETEQDRAVGAVAEPGQRERAVELDEDLGRIIEHAFRLEVPHEGPRGEHGCYVVSDGSNRPWRVHMRSPGLMACQALHKFIVGGMIADVIAVIGSLDVVMGDVDR